MRSAPQPKWVIPVQNDTGITSEKDGLAWKADVSAGTFVDSEVPSGTIDGANTSFTLANPPIAGSLHVYEDGIRTTQFSLSGTTLTMVGAPVFTLLVDYRK